jgi:competence protein ComEC
MAWALTAAAWGLLLWPAAPLAAIGEGKLTLLFVDVGQGDAALIRTPGGHWVAVDAGPLNEGFDAGKRVLVPLLHRYAVARLDAFVLSHAHRDHVGGARSLVADLPLTLAIDPGERFEESSYLDWLAELSTRGVRWHPATAGLEWTIDSVQFRVRHPPREWPHRGEDLNEDSIVLEVQYRDFTLLLMGDAGLVTENTLTAELSHVDVLKVGHHGSRGASSAAFLARVHPEVGVISVGRNNYGHPAPETLERLHDAGVEVWRTDREGTTSVITDGRQFTVRGGRTTATFEATSRRSPGR